MAKLGVGVMVIAQKPWGLVQEELAAYRKRFLELNHSEAPKPILAVFDGVSENRAEADRMRAQYLQCYARSTVEHCEFQNQKFAGIEGYEYYAGRTRNIAKHGLDKFNGFLAGLQIWGTPDEVTTKILDYVQRCDAGALIIQPRFGGMDPVTAQKNYQLFVGRVMPAMPSVTMAENAYRDFARCVRYISRLASSRTMLMASRACFLSLRVPAPASTRCSSGSYCTPAFLARIRQMKLRALA
jgi:Luciferase-like monooxygenase